MPSPKHTLFTVLCLFVLNFSAYALPLSVRQVDGSQILETVTTEMTSDGPVTATCTIVLTPITDGNGQKAVQEVKTCNLVLNPSPSQPTVSVAPVETSSQPSPATISSTTSNAVPITTASASPSGESGPISAHPVSSVTVSSSSVLTSSSTSKEAVSAQPVSTVTPNTSTSVSSPTLTGSSPGTTTTSTSAKSTFDASSTAPAAAEITSNASSTTTATSGAASGSTAVADSSNAAVDTGKKLSVLPIGLGVFAGISVIALIVVGLVTYERRKYRKAFRQRKLAESGAAMGYGGMAQ